MSKSYELNGKNREKGATVVEYCMMISLIAFSVITIFPNILTPAIDRKFREAGDAVSSTRSAGQNYMNFPCGTGLICP